MSKKRLKYTIINITYPENETRSPGLAPAGGSNGSTTEWSSFEAQSTCSQNNNKEEQVWERDRETENFAIIKSLIEEEKSYQSFWHYIS